MHDTNFCCILRIRNCVSKRNEAGAKLTFNGSPATQTI